MHHSISTIENAVCACTALRKASRAVTRFYDEALVGTGMSVIQFSILRNIARHEPLALARLADLLVMDRTTLYRALNPLGRQGWVAIADGEGRAKIATLTKWGRQALAGAEGAWRAAQFKLLGKIGMEDWVGIEASLARLVSVAQGLAE